MLRGKLLKLDFFARRLVTCYNVCATQNIRSTAHGPLWPAYLMRRGPIFPLLVLSNEEACVYHSLLDIDQFTTSLVSHPCPWMFCALDIRAI